MKEKNTTIKDIAKKLGIHHSTVSRALRDDPIVNKETVRLVKKTAREMNYKPNLVARNLKTRKSNYIGVIVPEIKHYFFSGVISGIEEVASKEGYVIFVCQSNEKLNREIMNTEALMANNIAGLLVSISQETDEYSHFERVIENDIKLVFFDRIIENLDVSKVVVDDYKGAFEATELLIKKGYKKIAHIAGAKGLSITKRRFMGYMDALKKNKMPFNEDYVFYSGFHENNGIDAMKYFLTLDEKPDAIFTVNDPTAIGAYEVIKNNKLKIPNDIAVIGFSNNPSSAIITPSLTTVEQPAYEMGKVAAKLLIDEIKENNSFRVKKVLPTKLIQRESV